MPPMSGEVETLTVPGARQRYTELIAMRKETIRLAEQAQGQMRKYKRDGDAMAQEMRRLKEFIDGNGG